jgi:hypothetical protein
MLLVANTSSIRNRTALLDLLSAEMVPVRLDLRRGQLKLELVRWREYWKPAMPFFECDARLVQRLNRLKRTWERLIARPAHADRQRQFAWRYFGLLHHTLHLTRAEPGRPNPFDAIERLVGFESFSCEAAETEGVCAATATHRNPLWALASVSNSSPLPSPRRVPILRPIGCDPAGYYHYRQIALDPSRNAHLLVHPAIEASHRQASFDPIERALRLCGSNSDPYARERAGLIAKRLCNGFLDWLKPTGDAMSIIDIGAGTGHLAARIFREARLAIDSIHFVDAHPPCSGRSFGIRGCPTDLQAVEWTVADYRELLDRESWLERNQQHAVALVCRLFENLSTFELCELDSDPITRWPHEALAQRESNAGLLVPSTRTEVDGGSAILQDPYRDYFAALKVLQHRDVHAVGERTRVVPVRRFNPAALTTRNGKSVLWQLLKIARVLFIDDMVLSDSDLLQHRQRFGLSGTSALVIEGDGHRTESKSFLVGRAIDLAHVQKGRRLW